MKILVVEDEAKPPIDTAHLFELRHSSVNRFLRDAQLSGHRFQARTDVQPAIGAFGLNQMHLSGFDGSCGYAPHFSQYSLMAYEKARSISRSSRQVESRRNAREDS